MQRLTGCALSMEPPTPCSGERLPWASARLPWFLKACLNMAVLIRVPWRRRTNKGLPTVYVDCTTEIEEFAPFQVRDVRAMLGGLCWVSNIIVPFFIPLSFELRHNQIIKAIVYIIVSSINREAASTFARYMNT